MEVRRIEHPHIEWTMVRGEPVTIRNVTADETLAVLTLSHDLAENFVVHWIELNGTPGALITSPFTSDNE
jgi:hypothetical protein